jgi:hypothetical protein
MWSPPGAPAIALALARHRRAPEWSGPVLPPEVQHVDRRVERPAGPAHGVDLSTIDLALREADLGDVDGDHRSEDDGVTVDDSESESSHSKAAAASAIPGTSTATDGARSMVAASNSLRPGWWPSLVASMVSTTSSVTR